MVAVSACISISFLHQLDKFNPLPRFEVGHMNWPTDLTFITGNQWARLQLNPIQKLSKAIFGVVDPGSAVGEQQVVEFAFVNML